MTYVQGSMYILPAAVYYASPASMIVFTLQQFCHETGRPPWCVQLSRGLGWAKGEDGCRTCLYLGFALGED